jgi:hypothetical protein
MAGAASADSSDAYAVWPASARLGDSIAVLLDAQAAVALAPEKAPLALEPGSFAIELTHLPAAGNPGIETLSPRAAVELPAALGSVLAGENGGSWTAIALLFDLPAAWTASILAFGDGVTVSVFYEGELVFDQKTLKTVGSGGQPLSAGGLETISGLEQRPMLRLRPAWDGAVGFDPSWSVGAVELVLLYTRRGTRDVANLEPVANGDATGAVTGIELLSETATEKRWNEYSPRRCPPHPPNPSASSSTAATATRAPAPSPRRTAPSTRRPSCRWAPTAP